MKESLNVAQHTLADLDGTSRRKNETMKVPRQTLLEIENTKLRLLVKKVELSGK